MQPLVVYDSKYGNVKLIAQAIGEAIGGRVITVEDAGSSEVHASNLLIIGSPTQGRFPTAGISELVKNDPAVAQMKVAA